MSAPASPEMPDPAPYQLTATTRSMLSIPTKHVFHYTDRAGYLGIIGGRALWASDVLFLNDSEEISLGMRLISEELTRRCESGRNKRRLAQIRDVVAAVGPRPAFVACISFSEVPDDLSQWRAYARGAGYAVGFTPVVFARWANAAGGTIARVVYDLRKQRRVAKRLVGELEARIEAVPKPQWTQADILQFANGFFVAALMCAVRMKDHAFAAEQEWRVSFVAMYNNMSAHNSRSLLVPHLAVPLDPTVIATLTVVAGPSPYPVLARESAARLMAANEPNPLTSTATHRVTNSKIPYRDW